MKATRRWLQLVTFPTMAAFGGWNLYAFHNPVNTAIGIVAVAVGTIGPTVFYVQEESYLDKSWLMVAECRRMLESYEKELMPRAKELERRMGTRASDRVEQIRDADA